VGCQHGRRGYHGDMQEDVAKPPPNRTTIQLNFRAPPEIADKLDAWLEEVNAGREVSKVTRNSALLSLLVWGLRERPAWIGEEPPRHAKKGG
jgi:hypothetical protein